MNVFYVVNPFFNIHNTVSSCSFQLTSTCLFLLLSSALFKYSNLPSTFFRSYRLLHMCLRGGINYPRFNISGRVFSTDSYEFLCDSDKPYSTVTSSMRQLWTLPTVINAMRQLSALSDSYQSYTTVISSMRQLLALSDSYQPYATVIGPMRQLWVPPTVIGSMRQLPVLSASY